MRKRTAPTATPEPAAVYPPAAELRNAVAFLDNAATSIHCAMVDARRAESSAMLALHADVCACLHKAKMLRNDMLADHAKETR